MSVQAGIWNLDGQAVNGELLAKFSEAIAEYGPDGERTYLDGSVGMLYRPFHTTSESRLEHQPHVSATGKRITWDGRLDNRDELISQLYDDIKADRTDVAIVAAAFDRWGTDAFARLTGDWALAIWNPPKKELILARDYIGVRHLFYYSDRPRIIWCSHLAPLAFCGDQFTLCEEYIAGLFALYPDAHLTPYREIHSVPPGQFVRILKGKISIHAHWTFNPRLRIRYKTDADYEEQYRHLLRQAVRSRLRADSRILAELSGGLDSSSIVCMADDVLAREGAETPRLDTFSYCDRNEPDDDDFVYFTKVEEKRGRNGHRAELAATDDTFTLEYNTFAAAPCLAIRQGVNTARFNAIRDGDHRVILSGTGGDEFNGQALDPRVHLADLLFQLQLGELTKQLMTWSLRMRRPWIQLLAESLVLLLPKWIQIRVTSLAKTGSWLNAEFAREHRIPHRFLTAAEGSWLWPPAVRDAFQTHSSLARQMSHDRPCVQELRYPYLDQKLVEFLMGIPTDQFLRQGQHRSLMRRALVGLVPPEILSRRTKSGASRFIAVTLGENWDRLESILDAPISSTLGYIEKADFRAALVAVKNGQMSAHTLQLIRGVYLERWLGHAAAQGVISIPAPASRTLRPKLKLRGAQPIIPA